MQEGGFEIDMGEYKIKSEINEVQVGWDIQSFLSLCGKGSKRWRLLASDEPRTGADAALKYNRGVPIYLQFKKSLGLKPATRISTRRNKAKEEFAREFRKERGLFDNPSLYFRLRKQAKTAVDLQHNILFDHHKPPESYAYYVAPLFLKLSEYEKAIQESANQHIFPFEWERLSLLDSPAGIHYLTSYVPFLRRHLCIPPHKKVNDHNHMYSYAPSGGDVAFHSGEHVEEAVSLATTFSRIFRYHLARLEAMPVLEAVIQNLPLLEEERGKSSPIEQLMAYGDRIYNEHSIQMYLLLSE